METLYGRRRSRHDTRKCAKYFSENLLIFGHISRNIHKSCFLRKYPGIVTQKSIDFKVMIPGNKLISGYCYSEINLFLGNNTRKLIYFQVSWPGNGQKTKFREYLRVNENIFQHILACESGDQVLLSHEKNQRSKISCYSPFSEIIFCPNTYLGRYLPTSTYPPIVHEILNYKGDNCTSWLQKSTVGVRYLKNSCWPLIRFIKIK